MANATSDDKRQLKIKTGVVKRVNKELSMYEKEVEDGEKKLIVMESSSQDPYDIKKFKEVVDESRSMVPDSKNRLRKALEDLDRLLEIADLENTEEYKQAKEIRDSVSL